MMTRRIISFFSFIFCLSSSFALVADELETFADLNKLRARTVVGFRSMNDGEHYTVMQGGSIIRYDYETGLSVDTICPSRILAPFILGSGSVTDYWFSDNERRILFSINSRPLYRRSAFSDYVIYDLDTHRVYPLTEKRNIRYALFSPDGERVAYVWENDIYIKNLDTDRETRVTQDGKINHIINGLPDWVYEEEFFMNKAFAWSPDGDKIAFLKFDESEVREFSITRFNQEPVTSAKEKSEKETVPFPLYTYTYTYKYPKAGENNSRVSLWVYDLGGGTVSRVDIPGGDDSFYYPRFGWTPDGNVWVSRLNRHQNHQEVWMVDRKGRCQILYEERSPAYIDVDETGRNLFFLPDTKHFIVRNETRTGFYHLYLYHIDRGFVRALTSGPWEVTELLYADSERAYYLSTERSPLRRDLYSVDLKGGNKHRMTDEEGTYRIAPSKGFRYYVSYFSNVSTPNTVTLHDRSGHLIRTLEGNGELKQKIANLNLSEKEFFTFVTPEGYELNGYLVRPTDFDSLRKYPVLMTQYSGPGSQQVADKWQLDWEDVLVRKGYVVACVDTRGTGYRGEAFKKSTYGRMGEYETEDQISAARYLSGLPWVDADRIGIYGWSYGGFMALNAILKGADVFKMAIAVAPVTSWRFYDSVYTERYNGLPQENAVGYDDNSPLNFAPLLRGRLLLMHGTGDDNVHIQNSYRMLSAFIACGKQVDLMVFPDDNHSMRPEGPVYIRQKMVDYCLENL